MPSLRINSAYRKLFTTTARYVHLIGGRSAGRSYIEGQEIIIKLMQPEYFRCLIARQHFSDIRESQFQQLVDIIRDNGLDDLFHIVDNTMRITCKATGNTVGPKGFKSSTGSAKAKMKSITGITHVWIEEADEVGWEDFMKLDLSLRTVKGNLKIVLTYNTEDEDCWQKAKHIDIPSPDVEVIHTTYLDNIRNLDANTIRIFEELIVKEPEYAKIYVLGQWGGGVKGRIYEHFTIADRWPEHFSSEAYGMDFGFTNDPTALVHIRLSEGVLYIRLLIYQKGLTNPEIAALMKAFGIGRTVEVWADSAEPKSIEEIYRHGFNIKPAVKGPDSVNLGIQKVKQYPVRVYASPDLNKEVKQYRWATDKDGNTLNKPIDAFNHALDAVRYALVGMVGVAPKSKKKAMFTQMEIR